MRERERERERDGGSEVGSNGRTGERDETSEKHRREKREWKKRASANAAGGLFSSGSSFNPSNLLLATRAAPVSTGVVDNIL